MEQAKHTPGPWKAVINSADYWEVVHQWPDQSVEEANSYSPTVVHVCTKNGEEQEANARLIAAAPELLEFAQEWLSLQGGDNNHMTTKAKSAIDKATGATQ